MARTMLTTIDNPYDPFTHWDEWYQWDEQAGYHTCGLLARLAHTSDELSEADQELELDSAIDEIVKDQFYGPYRKVTTES